MTLYDDPQKNTPMVDTRQANQYKGQPENNTELNRRIIINETWNNRTAGSRQIHPI